MATRIEISLEHNTLCGFPCLKTSEYYYDKCFGNLRAADFHCPYTHGFLMAEGTTGDKGKGERN